MNKTIGISKEAHRIAKSKAERVGMSLAAFVEAAIREFTPVLSLVSSQGDVAPQQKHAPKK